VQASQEDWLERRYEDPDPHVWVTKNAAALAEAEAYAKLAYMIENIGETSGESVGSEGHG